MLRFVIKNSILYTLASQVPMFANLLLYPIISEHLTTFDYFVYGTAMGYIGLLTMIGDLGMPPLFQNTFFKQHRWFKRYWSKFMGFLIIYKFFYGAVVGLTIWLVFRTEIPPDRLHLIVAMVVLPMVTLDITRGLGMRLMQFHHKHRVVHVSTAIAGCFAVATTYITVYIYRLGYLGFFISNFVSVMVQGVFFAWVIYGAERIIPSFKLRKKRIISWLKISLPIIPHKFSDYLLSSSDRVVLDQYLNVSNVSTNSIGMYNVAYNFASYFHTFTGQINTVISPIYFSLFRDQHPDTNTFIRSFTYIWLGASYIGASLLGLWSKEIFSFFFMNNTTGLADAYKYSIFLFMAFCYRPLYVASVEFIIFQEKTLSLFKITTAAGIINVVLNLILVPFFGIESAIFSTFLCYMYMGISGHLFRGTRKHIPVSYHVIPIFFIITITAILITYAVEFYWMEKAMITGALLLVTAIWYTRKGSDFVTALRAHRLKIK